MKKEEIKMKKRMVFLMVLLSALLICGQTKTGQVNKKIPRIRRNRVITLSLGFPVIPTGLGYKHPLSKYLYATGSVTITNGSKDLLFRSGIEYQFPVRVLIFHFYVGTGLQFSRNAGGYQYPYTTIGTRCLIFFSEMVMPMKGEERSSYRLGFNFRF
jgi:hypothetical protein